MENLYFDNQTKITHSLSKISKVHYQPASNTLIVMQEATISLFIYQPKTNIFDNTAILGPIQEIASTNIILLEWMVDEECVLAVGSDGSIFTINKQGDVDIKAQNEDGIVGASFSPTQEYLYIATSNKTLIQLNKEFDLVNQIPIDEQEEVISSITTFGWRVDGSFFSLNYQTVNGRKAVTKDIMMTTFISPSKSDPNENGHVQSVSEKGKSKFRHLVAWQPSGGVIAGVDYLQKGQKKQHRIIFWEKNGLRHLQFDLPTTIESVQDLFWNLDSSILFVRAKYENGQHRLLQFYRANYRWFLKNSISLKDNDFCLNLNSQKYKKHKLLVVRQSIFEVLQYSIRLSEKQWKTQSKQLKFKHEFHYFIDGNFVNITDFSKCLMPPPMSMIRHDFENNIVGVSKNRQALLIITQTKIYLFDIIQNQVVASTSLGDLINQQIFGVRLLSTNTIEFVSGGHIYSSVEGSAKMQRQFGVEPLQYSLQSAEGDLNFEVSYQNEQLTVNGNKVSEQCTSFIFYQQFLLFTVSTSNMYDKMFVINLFLDGWINQEGSKTKERLAELQNKELLNHRLIERGSKIVCVSDGRVVFQLPRGNLEGIYPKVIMINLVKKKIALKQYRAAFQIIRSDKLDFNLIYDIDPQKYISEIQFVLKDIKRVDYINLLVAQISETLSSQLQYILPSKILEERKKNFELNLNGKKVKSICRLVSQTLRKINKQEYILSIFTSQIKEGRLNDVLFELKELKQNDVQVVQAPHQIKGGQKNKKIMSSKQILQYVCWLVDANAIYEAALLTYDLQLAAMTARYTQKDPKQYIPYLQGLKTIANEVQFRKTICLDLKRYQIAVKELSKGSLEQRNQSLELIKKHKLYKHGLIIYSQRQELKQVKQLIIEQLFATGQANEAYRVCQSLGLHQKALQIAKNLMDTKKIKQCLQLMYQNQEQRIKQANLIINIIKDEIKNRTDLARLYAYVGQYEDAVAIYLKHNQYRKAYKYLFKVQPAFRDKQMKEGFQLCYSIKRNQIVRDRKDFIEKYSRLLRVHQHKAQNGEVINFRPRENEDMYSQVSVNSKSQSNYTMSTTTGMRKKKDKKRSILTRNVKQGSPLEEEYILAYIQTLQDKVEDAVKDTKLLIQHLICMNLVEEAEQLRDEVRQYIQIFSNYRVKSFAKTKFEEAHPEAVELYYQEKKINALTIDSFNYLF